MRCGTLSFVACLAVVMLAAPLHAQDPAPTVEQIRMLMNAFEQTDNSGEKLLKHGDRAFPAYEAIISDPKSLPIHVMWSFEMVSLVKGDRSRFVDLAAGRLTDEFFDVRKAALRLIAEAGSERDTAPIVAMLSDENTGVRRDAAKTILKIGGKRDVVALDIWLKSGNHQNDPKHVKFVKECREQLEKRLKDKSVPKDAKN